MKITPDLLQSYTLRNLTGADPIPRILVAGLHAVDPYQAVINNLRLQRNTLSFRNTSVNLNSYNQIFVIGIGKAAVPMTAALLHLIGERVSRGIVVTKRGHRTSDDFLPPKIQIIEAGHPIPDQQSVRGAKELIRLLKDAHEDVLVLCCFSGGGSALITDPMPGITLDEIQALTAQLLACGATIDETNTIRKHLDRVKAGGLLTHASSARWICLILSDVIGDPLDRIASGPTAPDPSTFAEAENVIKKYHLSDVPNSIRNHIRRGITGEIEDTLKPGNPIFDHVDNLIVGNVTIAANASLQEAQKYGFNTLLLTTSLQGEASQAGIFLGAIAQQIARTNQPISRPACLVAGGETTVSVCGSGLGGRNQELALGAVRTIAGLENIILVTLATDGGDGPTDAAGAVVSGDTFHRAMAMGLDPQDFLARNDSYRFFDPLGDLLKPGATLTNVGDLTFLFAL